MSRGKGLAPIFLLVVALSGCAQAPQASEDDTNIFPPDDRLVRVAAAVDMLRCTDRAAIPALDNVTNAMWSPDSNAVAMSRISVIPSHTTITGYEEELDLTVYYLGTGRIQEIGQGRLPQWSGSGAYLSYWGDDGYLYVNLDGTIAGTIEASSPQVRWTGDDLYYWYADEIRVWHEGVAQTVAHVEDDLIPRYPRDDSYFSADAKRFTVTRYSLDGTTERYLGVTATGEMTKLEDQDVTFTEWAPQGETLLVRSSDKLALIDPSGTERSAALAAFAGAVHGWTADGRLLVGAVSATVPGGNVFDRIPVWDPSNALHRRVATLPNLFGTRSFSPDGRWFTGVSRTGLYETQLELYRCGVANGQGIDLRADPASRSRLGRIDDASRRFVRPVAGAVSQFMQGNHTGLDIAAPFGSIIVAADDGVVDATGWVQVGGRRVCVQHAEGFESCYYHTSAALVSTGDRVVRGQPIALVGMTGATTGPHVHWELKENGRIVDPLSH
ncbi:MAG: peptidoglycan DD-metalloendopeptidase family protein [Chloroflexota bacterium]|nr:peptidoglycan DD-metalloendopeptidase family protein [Chloroflexota bacterium]